VEVKIKVAHGEVDVKIKVEKPRSLLETSRPADGADPEAASRTEETANELEKVKAERSTLIDAVHERTAVSALADGAAVGAGADAVWEKKVDAKTVEVKIKVARGQVDVKIKVEKPLSLLQTSWPTGAADREVTARAKETANELEEVKAELKGKREAEERARRRAEYVIGEAEVNMQMNICESGWAGPPSMYEHADRAKADHKAAEEALRLCERHLQTAEAAAEAAAKAAASVAAGKTPEATEEEEAKAARAAAVAALSRLMALVPAVPHSAFVTDTDRRVLEMKLDLRGCEAVDTLGTWGDVYTALDSERTRALCITTQLSSLPAGWRFSGLQSLVRVEIPWCIHLQELPPRLFRNCHALQAVVLTNCQQLGTLPDAIFDGCDALETVSLDRCVGVRTLPESLLRCDQLRTIAIDYSGASDQTPDARPLPSSAPRICDLRGRGVVVLDTDKTAEITADLAAIHRARGEDYSDEQARSDSMQLVSSQWQMDVLGMMDPGALNR